MKYILIAILLISQSAYAAGTEGHISANIVEIAVMSQDSKGVVTTSGQEPLYCTSDASGVMCYY